MEALARSAVASPHWRWGQAGDALPDLDDAATLGCLLQLVRNAWGDPLLVTHGEHDDGDVVWTVRQPLRHGSRVIGRGWSEAEALVAALLAAPEDA